MSTVPALQLLEGGGVGTALREARVASGLPLEQVAASTRIRLPQLRALEAGEFDRLPAAVYLRGYVRAYAELVGLDPEPLLAQLPSAQPVALRRLGSGGPARLAITGPALAAGGLLLASLLFGLYAWRELESARQAEAPPPVAASPPPIASPAPLPSAAATAAPAPVRLVSVAVRATEQVWLSVTIDGKPYYGPSGRFLNAGQSDLYVGQDVRIASGKSSLLVSLDGGDYAPIGGLSKEYSAQT
jgi:hypothetical protein